MNRELAVKGQEAAFVYVSKQCYINGLDIQKRVKLMCLLRKMISCPSNCFQNHISHLPLVLTSRK